METKALADGLIELARRQAALPNGRERVVDALRATLVAVDGRCAGCWAASTGVETALVELIDHLTYAADHVEFLREIITPPARQNLREGAADRSSRR